MFQSNTCIVVDTFFSYFLSTFCFAKIETIKHSTNHIKVEYKVTNAKKAQSLFFIALINSKPINPQMETFDQIVKSGRDIVPLLDRREQEEMYQYVNRLSLYIAYFEENENVIEQVFDDMTKDKEKYRQQMTFQQYLEELFKAKKALETTLEKKNLITTRLHQAINSSYESIAEKEIKKDLRTRLIRNPDPLEQMLEENLRREAVQLYNAGKKQSAMH